MKKIIITGLLVLAFKLPADEVTNNFTITPAATISVGNVFGVTEYFTVSGLTAPTASVRVNLNILGGFNGDLYAYLVNPLGQQAILLNRVGVTGSNLLGYSDAGFNITLDSASGNNIHNYGVLGFGTNVAGQVTGVWAPDGRAIDPLSAGSAFDTALTTSGLNGLTNGNLNGTWTLFIADLGTGSGAATLQSATVTVESTPEPSTFALMGLGVAGILARLRRKK